jgi:hypothetical protein
MYLPVVYTRIYARILYIRHLQKRQYHLELAKIAITHRVMQLLIQYMTNCYEKQLNTVNEQKIKQGVTSKIQNFFKQMYFGLPRYIPPPSLR